MGNKQKLVSDELFQELLRTLNHTIETTTKPFGEVLIQVLHGHRENKEIAGLTDSQVAELMTLMKMAL